MKTTEIQKQIDENYLFLIKEARKTNYPEGFSKSEKTKKIAFEIVDLIREKGQKTTFNNLTNMNFHLLVKILNFNDYFKKQITQDVHNELKKLTFIH